MLVCAFLCANCTRDRGCSVHPVFPAPSKFWRANQDANLGRSASREGESVFRRMGGAKRYPSPQAPALMGIAEFIIGPAEDRTRWLHPSYRSHVLAQRRPVARMSAAISGVTLTPSRIS